MAINAEDEIFTYDNTDDGNGWWTRLTHMVDGGFYGYPYDYKPRRPYTLWMMADYGGGSPTGGLAYNEDALPRGISRQPLHVRMGQRAARPLHRRARRRQLQDRRAAKPFWPRARRSSGRSASPSPPTA